MQSKIVSIRRSMPADAEAEDGRELYASAAALDACLTDLSEQSPRLVALAWCVDGTPGSLCAVRASDSETLIVRPDTQDQLKALAVVVEGLPELLRETFEVQMDWIRAKRALEAAESPLDAPEPQR